MKWVFIPPLAPNFGGLWEAGVKSVKTHLVTQCKEESFTYEELMTLLCEIEVCLNARPLCPLNDDPDSLNALTPQHFLTQDLLAGDIDGRDFLSTPEKYLSRWERMKKMRQEVCSRYRDEYITRLNNRPKQFTPKGNLVVGQLVLLREEHSPSSEWPLGRIAKTHPGDDGLVRVVTIVTQSGEKKRAVNKVCPLQLFMIPEDIPVSMN